MFISIALEKKGLDRFAETIVQESLTSTFAVFRSLKFGLWKTASLRDKAKKHHTLRHRARKLTMDLVPGFHHLLQSLAPATTALTCDLPVTVVAGLDLRHSRNRHPHLPRRR
jgi:hypothetical protein